MQVNKVDDPYYSFYNLFQCALNPGKKASWIVNLVQTPNHKSELKVIKRQFLTNFQRAYVCFFLNEGMGVPKNVGPSLVLSFDFLAIPTN
jgi:hypothetical protein